MKIDLLKSLVYNDLLKKAIAIFPTIYNNNGNISIFGHTSVKEVNINDTINCIDEGDSVLFTVPLESTVYLLRCLKTDPSVGMLILPHIYNWNREEF